MEIEATLNFALEEGAVRCQLCAHRCRIEPGETGFCNVRINRSGVLYTTAYGNIVAKNVDPIEKKPLFHFLPDSRCYSLATAGCNFRCGFCQNWQISQTAPDTDGRREVFLSPQAAAAEAIQSGSKSIAFTYTEPSIFYEYARAVALEAKKDDLKTVFVTNGYMSRQLLDDAAPWLDAANVDLKAWRDEYYQNNCGAHLQPVLKSIAYMKQLGIWVEVTTLVIPDENDSDEELTGIAEFIAGVGTEIPWHISRFHPTYQFNSHLPTPLETLKRAERIGREAGLKYVYLGNVPEESHTRCPACKNVVVNRSNRTVDDIQLDKGKCCICGETVEGRWA